MSCFRKSPFERKLWSPSLSLPLIVGSEALRFLPHSHITDLITFYLSLSLLLSSLSPPPPSHTAAKATSHFKQQPLFQATALELIRGWGPEREVGCMCVCACVCVHAWMCDAAGIPFTLGKFEQAGNPTFDSCVPPLTPAEVPLWARAVGGNLLTLHFNKGLFSCTVLWWRHRVIPGPWVGCHGNHCRVTNKAVLCSLSRTRGELEAKERKRKRETELERQRERERARQNRNACYQ